MSAIGQQDWATAEVLLAEAVEVCSVCPEARRYYAETLWHKGDTAGALEHMNAAIDLAPQDATLWVRLAEMKLDGGRLGEARADADTAIDLDPGLASAWIVRAHVKQRNGELSEALADFHRALACDAGQSDALLEVAEVYRQIGDPQRALMSLQGAAERYSPGDEPPRVLYLTGMAYTALGRYDDALIAYRAALARGGAHPELSFRTAEALWLAQQPDAAREALSDALSQNPEHVASRQLLECIELAGRPVDGRR
jgi:tetratricopeptide (TPR) repeat protein